jgi:chromosome partitioning protein
MPIIITLAHQKGGVGKSTLAINLYGYFTQAGYKTAIIDIDPQGSITSLLQTFGGEGGREGVALIERAGFSSYEELGRLVEGREIVLIDTPPYLSKELQQVLALSHLVLIPCKASPLDALAVVQTVALVKEEQARNPALVAAFVLTMTIAGTGFPKQIREHLGRHGLPILDVEIVNRVAYARSLLFSNSVIGETNDKAKDEIIQLGQELIELLDRTL